MLRSRLSYQASLGAAQSEWVTWADLVDRLLVTVSLHDSLHDSDRAQERRSASATAVNFPPSFVYGPDDVSCSVL